MSARVVAAEPLVAGGTVVRRLVWIGFFALLTGAGAWIRIPLPFTPVLITLQTLFVLSAGVVLGRDGIYSQLLYLLLGGIGLPLFAGGAAKFQYLLGPTGGYLVGFVAAAALANVFLHREWSMLPIWSRAIRLFAVSLVVFVPGVLQLAFVTNLSIQEAFMIGCLPFLIGDVVKVLAVSVIPSKVLRRRS